MMSGRVSVRGRLFRLFGRSRREGSRAVGCAAAAPLMILAIAVASDYSTVTRFRTRVQQAAEAASLAAAEVAARQSDRSADDAASRLAGALFVSRAPCGAGTPTVEVRSGALAATATVGYAGVAPSNFGSALGYDWVSADASATSPARLADARSATSP